MKVKVMRGHSYNRKYRQQGDVYHIDNTKHFKLLKLLKKVVEAPESATGVNTLESKKSYSALMPIPPRKGRKRKSDRRKKVNVYDRKDIVSGAANEDTKTIED